MPKKRSAARKQGVWSPAIGNISAASAASLLGDVPAFPRCGARPLDAPADEWLPRSAMNGWRQHQRASESQTPTATSNEEMQVAEAIWASRVCSMQNASYDASLTRALEESRAIAAAQVEEAEALRFALEASVTASQQKILGLGLKGAVNSRSELIAEAIASTSLVANAPASHGSGAVGIGCSEMLAEVIAEPIPVSDVSTSQITGIAEPAAPLCHILKVTHKNDTRRLRAQWPIAAKSSDVFANIQSSVEEGFALPFGSVVPPAFFMKYVDNEGDLCTLVKNTLPDFLDMALHGGTLKIVLEVGLQTTSLQGSEDFSISTPPATPRGESSIEDDYDSMWSLVEVDSC